MYFLNKNDIYICCNGFCISYLFNMYTIRDYNKKSFYVYSENPEDTKKIKKELKQLGGKWNTNLNAEDGTKFSAWIFSKSKENDVKQFLDDGFLPPIPIKLNDIDLLKKRVDYLENVLKKITSTIKDFEVHIEDFEGRIESLELK